MINGTLMNLIYRGGL